MEGATMHAIRLAILGVAALTGPGARLAANSSPQQEQACAVVQARLASSPGFRLIQNLGQFPTPARFVGQLPGTIVRVEPDTLLVDLRGGAGGRPGVLVRLVFEGASDDVVLEGCDPVEGTHSFFR